MKTSNKILIGSIVAIYIFAGVVLILGVRKERAERVNYIPFVEQLDATDIRVVKIASDNIRYYSVGQSERESVKKEIEVVYQPRKNAFKIVGDTLICTVRWVDIDLPSVETVICHDRTVSEPPVYYRDRN